MGPAPSGGNMWPDGWRPASEVWNEVQFSQRDRIFPESLQRSRPSARIVSAPARGSVEAFRFRGGPGSIATKPSRTQLAGVATKELFLTSADDSARDRPPVLEKATEARLMFPKILKSPRLLTEGVQDCLSGESFYFSRRFRPRPSLNVLAP